MDKPVATIVTQTVVSKDDPAFQNPTKPVGAFYDKELLSGGIAQCVAAQRDNDSLRHNALPHCFRFFVSACPL